MSRMTVVVTGAVLAAASVTTAILATGSAAGTTPVAKTVHTQRFHAEATAQLTTGKTSFLLAERDVTGLRTTGYDVLFCQATRTHSNCQIAVAEKGGLVYAGFHLRGSDHKFRGSVTGGTGRYHGAHGTIAGQVLSQSDVRVALNYQV